MATSDSPAAGQAATVQAAFEALQRQFVAGLPARWSEIAQASDPTTRAAALHRLAGAAGGYGFHELGQAARRAERSSEQAADAHWAELERLLMALGVTVR